MLPGATTAAAAAKDNASRPIDPCFIADLPTLDDGYQFCRLYDVKAAGWVVLPGTRRDELVSLFTDISPLMT